ncbi:MAG TPA: hypothetical protein VK158_02940 [Acidobacteriota bacterium]|nr:hypothetical protein [Acidobacteriota bacterium]
MKTLAAYCIKKNQPYMIGNDWFERTASQIIFSKHACPWTTDFVQTRPSIHRDFEELGLVPTRHYDDTIMELPSRVTPDQLGAYEKKYGQKITAEEYVWDRRMKVVMYNHALQLRMMMRPSDWKNEDLSVTAGSLPSKPTDFDIECTKWFPGFGSLVKYKSGERFSALREYLVVLSACPEIFISLVQNREGNRLYLGFRQGGGTDFPIDQQTKWGLSIDPRHSETLLANTVDVMKTIEDFVK